MGPAQRMATQEAESAELRSPASSGSLASCETYDQRTILDCGHLRHQSVTPDSRVSESCDSSACDLCHCTRGYSSHYFLHNSSSKKRGRSCFGSESDEGGSSRSGSALEGVIRPRLMAASGSSSQLSCSDSDSQGGCEGSASPGKEWSVGRYSDSAHFCEVAVFPGQQSRSKPSSDIIMGLACSGQLLATAGVSKQVRVYSSAFLEEDFVEAQQQQPVAVHRMPSKLSSIAWNPHREGVVTLGDYDGTVTQMDIVSGHFLADVDGHCGRRVWDVAHSALQPHLCASTSDDGTCRLWPGQGLGQSLAVLNPAKGASVCSAHFCPTDSNLLALASADSRAYLYDLRNLQEPLQVLSGHSTACHSVRFMGRSTLVTAAIDNTLVSWDISAAQESPTLRPPQHSAAPQRVFRGHANSKNFVGLSVLSEAGLVACGSECGGTFAYRLETPSPLAVHRTRGDNAGRGNNAGFVSAVCWLRGGETPVLASAGSDGGVRVLALRP